MRAGGRPAAAVVEHVPEVPAACGADLGAHHAVARVDTLHDRVERGRLDEARPSRAGVELRIGPEELGPAAGAAVDARVLGVGVRPGERPLRRLRRRTAYWSGVRRAPLLVRELYRARHA